MAADDPSVVANLSRLDEQPELVALAARCDFPTPPATISCAFSGGPDSTALIALARAAGLDVVAHHVDHGMRSTSALEAEQAAAIAERLGCRFVLHQVTVAHGPNLEARARAARLAALPPDAATGHTLDDQAETVLIRLMRGSGSSGLAGIEPGRRHPLLGLRRHETEGVCERVGVDPVRDPTNDPANHSATDSANNSGVSHDTQWRKRVRHELLPLLADIAQRDPGPILARTAALLADDDEFLNRLAADIDPTDCRTLRTMPPTLARRALRNWLTLDGYPPDAPAIERVLDVVHGHAIACEIGGGRRIARSAGLLRVLEPGQ